MFGPLVEWSAEVDLAAVDLDQLGAGDERVLGPDLGAAGRPVVDRAGLDLIELLDGALEGGGFDLAEGGTEFAGAEVDRGTADELVETSPRPAAVMID